MSRESLIFLLGLIIFFLPVIGVPTEWKDYTLWATGTALVILGISLRRSAYLRRIRNGNSELRTDSFVESVPKESPEPSLLNEDAIRKQTEIEV